MTQVNVNKFIASSGYCSRRQADRLVKAGKVKINNVLAKLTDKIGPEDKVFIENKEIKPELKKYILLLINQSV